MASPLEKARRTAERKGAYAEGNRNNFIFVMAARANRLGVKRAEMEAYAATAFADLRAPPPPGKRAGARWTWSPWRPIYPSVSSPARTA